MSPLRVPRDYPITHGRHFAAATRATFMSPLRLSHVYPITYGRHFAAVTPNRRQTPPKPPPTRRGATCDARPTAGRQHNRPHACARHSGDMNVAPTFIPRLSHATNQRGRHFAAATPHAHTPHKPPTRRGATCDARPTAGRQRNRPHACARHPGDMNVAPTHMPDNHCHANPHTTPPTRHHTPPTRRGATCDARPTAGRQRNRPHACARHPGDMNVAPTCIPLYPIHHHAQPAFHRRHPGDMNVAPTCILRLSHATAPRGRRRALLLYICVPTIMRAAPAFPFCQEKKKKTGGNAFFLNFYS